MPKIKTFIFSLLLIIAPASMANFLDHQYQRNIRVQSLSIEDGLSQSVITDILQDRFGYMWFATEDGLNRFDGYEFTVYQPDHDNPHSIHESYVLALAESQDDGLWIGTHAGLSYFDQETSRFQRFFTDQDDLQSTITSLGLSSNNRLYIGSENGLYVAKQDLQEAILVRSEEGFPITDEINAIETYQDKVWAATSDCIYYIQEQENFVKNLCLSELGAWFASREIRRLAYHENHLWIGTNHGLAKLNLETAALDAYTHKGSQNKRLSSDRIQSLNVDKKGDLWIGTAAGLNVFRISDDLIDIYTYSAHNKDGLTADDIMSVFTDKDGLIWLGTYAAGINLLDPNAAGIQSILSKSDVAKFDSSNTVHGIVKDHNENLWVATYPGGLMKFNLMTGELTRPFHDVAIPYNLDFNYLYALTIDYKNRLWVGSAGGLFIVDLNDQKFLPAIVKIQGELVEFDHFIYQLYEDHSGQIWIASEAGLFLVDTYQVKKDFVSINLINKQYEVPFTYRELGNRVSSLIETRDGDIWIGGRSGLLRYDKTADDWQHYSYQAGNLQSLSHNDVQVLFEDSRGILWVGTGNGLNKVNRTDDNGVYFERITKSQGLPNNSIYGILEDNFKQIWLSTNLGLVRFSGQRETIRNFRKSDGLSSDEFNTAAYFADNDGILYFGSIDGITIVDSRYLQAVPQKRKLIFSEVKVGERRLDTFRLNRQQLPQITLQENESTIRIALTDLYFRKLRTQSYRYRLLGLSDEWNYIGRERVLTLAGLPEGRYLLDVQSQIGNEPWAVSSLRAELIIQASIWQSRNVLILSIIFSIITLSIISYFLSRYVRQKVSRAETRVKIESVRLKDVKKQNEELQVEIESKRNELALITEKLNEASSLVESYQFRDTITGFYRFDYVKQLMLETLASANDDSVFNLIAVIQLSDLNHVKKEKGMVAAAELSEQVAAELKRQFSADSHFCSVSDDIVLIISSASFDSNVATRLLQARNRIVSTKYRVINDLTVQTRIGLSYFELSNQKVNDIELAVNLSELLIAYHKKQNPQDVSGAMRVDVNRDLEEFRSMRTPSTIAIIVEGNWLTSHFV